jgi:translation elongation factor EF-4
MISSENGIVDMGLKVLKHWPQVVTKLKDNLPRQQFAIKIQVLIYQVAFHNQRSCTKNVAIKKIGKFLFKK